MSIPTLISRWAHERPHDAAIADGERRVTWRDLEEAAAGIAQRIAASNAGCGNACLLFEDKRAGIEALAGAMWAGCVAVPLDAGNPEERLRYILNDAAPSVLLTDGANAGRARAVAPPGCVVVDVDSPCVGSPSMPVKIDPAAVAYIAYTSGSTGAPKGVMQTHENMQFYVASYGTMFGIGPRDRLGTLSPLGVPAGNSDILRGLLLGTTLCLYDVRRRGIAELADWLDRTRVTVLHVVPTVWRDMTTRMPPQRVLPHLRIVHLGGEAVFGGDVAQFRAHTSPQCVLFTQLSGAETSVIARNVIAHATAIPLEGIVPAGRPIEGVGLDIVREDGTPAAQGEVGEIVTVSRHLSPGYWRRPELTATAFTSDSARPDWRRYRTGDLGHIDAEGNLHFHGRSGTRVKVHGYSVDLMEIEAALSSSPQVVRGAVIARRNTAEADSARIVAYVEVRDGGARDARAVRRHLAERLPPYMLPVEILFIAAMPLTIGGKIDRQRLDGLPTLPGVDGDAVRMPRDEIERGVAREFERLLEMSSARVDDDFFLMGGDSLLSAELQSSLMRAYGMRIDGLHEDATVGAIAARIRRERDRGAARLSEMPVMLALWRDGNQIPFFVVHGRHGQAFVSPHFMRLMGDDQPVWTFQARGLDGKSEPHASIEAMADEYLAKLREVRPHGPYFLGSLCAGVFIVTIIARRLRDASETVLPLLLLDPPNSVFQQGYLALTREQFERKMRERKANGRTGGPVEDPAYMQSLIRTVLAFERAIATHRPQPYDGDVFVLSSSARAQGADAAFFRRMFTGKAVRHVIGATHKSALSPHNPAFVQALADSVAHIRAAGERVAVG